MPDRADYLAKTLVSRMRNLEIALLDDAAPSRSEQDARRYELVQKVLAIEAGTVDHSTTQLVLAAMPAFSPFEAVPQRQVDELAAFLRSRVDLVGMPPPT
jgi:hypothetical protein